jgi:type IV secretory pathway TraG/TraD family ATPase VirD4
MEHVLRNCLFAIFESGGGTLTDILSLLSDKDFRQSVVKQIKNEAVRAFWENEFPKYSDRYRVDSIAPIQNKVGAFLADPRMRRIVCAPAVDLSLRRVMDSSQVLIINLAKGVVGEDSSSLLGALLMTTFGLAAYSRANVSESERRPYYLFVDEFHAFTTLAVADMISELRKYSLALTVAHQHFEQLEEGVKHALIGNAGTLLSFRVGAEDARLLSREFEGVFSENDLVGLPNYSICLKLMIDGGPSRPFSARTISP